MRRRLFALLCLVLFAGSANICAVAQNYLYGTGNQSWGINLPIENGFINVANGEIHLEIPIATLPQRGSIPLNERLVYDSRIWQLIGTGTTYDFEPTNVSAPYSGFNPSCVGNPPAACTSNTPGTVTFVPVNAPNSMAGWRFVAGNETGIIQEYLNGNGSDLQSSWYYAWGWTDPSGTTHQFPFSTGSVYCPSCGPISASGYAVDGSGYYMTVTNYTSPTVFDSNGNEVYPQIVDRNGNNFTTDGNGNLIDTMGRTPVLKSISGNNTHYDVLTIGGARKRYTVTTETINVHTAFGQSGTTGYSGTLTAIQSIGLPDGTSYTFTYDSGTTGNYGSLESMTLPTGGAVSFGWSNYLDSYQNVNRWLTSYSGGKGSYTFTPSVVTQCSGPTEVGCQENVKAVDGSGNYVQYLLTLNNGAWNSQMDYYDASNQDVLSTATTYNFATSCTSWECSGAQWVTAMSSTQNLQTLQFAQTQYTYDYPWSGKPSTVKRWDYYSSTPSSVPTKETDYTYSTLINHAYFVTQVNQLDSSGKLTAQTVLNYDQGTPTTAAGATNIASAPGGTSRGNLTSVVSGVGSTITTSSTYDTAGQKLTDVDGNLNSTSYSYLCSDAYLGATTLPITVNGSALQSQTTYDCSSGLVASTKDPNGVVNNLATTYTYFPSGTNIGRLETVANPDGGKTSYAYPSSTETDQTTAQTSSVNAVSKQFLDEYGRTYQSAVVAPEGSISTETTYDATGKPSCVTTAHVSGKASPTDGTTCTYYDVLGRTTKTLLPDGNSVNAIYEGNLVQIMDELGHNKQYIYDAFHRLTSTIEPNANNILTYETDYQYNALDELVQVDQWGGAKGATSPGDRQRLFAYDSLGREIAEKIPENQSLASPASLTCTGTVAGTKWTSCFGYDSNNNMVSSTDNANTVTTYHHDALNRITAQQAPGINYGYFYDQASLGYAFTAANPVGHLVEASNQVNASEQYSYDTMGRIVLEAHTLPYDCCSVASQTGDEVSVSYDLAGNMTSLTYPDGRVVAQSYDEANRLKGVSYSKWGPSSIGTSYLSTSTFAPPGQAENSSMGDGIGIAAAYNSRQSITSLAYSNSTSTLWSKQFNWDKNASNLLSIIDGVTGYGRTFSYDTLNRLTGAQDGAVNTPGSTNSTGTITISGTENSTVHQTCTGSRSQCPPQTIYNQGVITLSVNGTVAGTASYSGSAESKSTDASVATALAASVNSMSPSFVTATASGATVSLTSSTPGSTTNYSLSTSTTYYSQYFTSSPFSATTSGSAMTGGTGIPPSGLLNETYTYDPFGNLTQSGDFSLSQSFNALNQIADYSYDANGNQNTDVYNHPLAFDANGMLSSVSNGGETYSYDPEGNRVEVHGSTVTDYIYFGGVPIATVTGGVYTDLIYAGGSLIAEVGGTQTAVPTYRISDHLGSLGGSLVTASAISSPMNYAPYGQQFTGTTSDPFGFTGLQWDTTTATNHATARQFSIQQGRWQSPDPDSGSYDWTNPQSLNRYAYVNGMPTALSDPSGLDGGGGGGSPIGVALNIFYDFYLLMDFSDFHGSLKPRPSANPWSDKFGVPYGGLGNGIGQALGLPSGGCDFGACGSSFTDYNRQQTSSQLQTAYNEVTAGRIIGLLNIKNHSCGECKYDYGWNSHSADTWNICGRTFNADQMGNFMAGYQAGVYDKNYFWTTGAIWAQGSVDAAGVLYHMTGRTKATTDPLDRTGMPDILRGQRYARHGCSAM